MVASTVTRADWFPCRAARSLYAAGLSMCLLLAYRVGVGSAPWGVGCLWRRWGLLCWNDHRLEHGNKLCKGKKENIVFEG